MQDELDELLVLFLADPLDERLRLERLAELDGRQAVLGEAKVKVIGDCINRGWSESALSNADAQHWPCHASALTASDPGVRLANSLCCPWTASCSVILGRSDPPTKPMTAFCLTCLSTSSISGDAVRRAGVSVPSTSVRQSTRVEACQKLYRTQCSARNARL